MKNKSFLLLIVIFFLTSNILFAHGDEDHLKKSQDTSEMMGDTTLTEEYNAHQHPAKDDHNMI